MAYVPKTLMVGRCHRCGKRLYAMDTRYVCRKRGLVLCETCARKLQFRCPPDYSPMEVL